MGVFGAGFNPKVNVGQIADGMKTAVRQWMNDGYCIIIDPTKKIVNRTIATGAMSVIQFPVGSGHMRLQPLKRPLIQHELANDSTSRMVQIWVDFPKDQTIPDIKPGFEVIVTNGANDPYNTGYQFVVTSSINSSMSWHRTINTLVNMESKPNYQWSFLSGTISDVNGGISGVTVQAQYQSSPGVWVDYTSQLTSDNTYRVPVFMGTTYRLVFSKTGYTTQTTGVLTPLVFTDVAGGNIVLA